MFLLISLAFVVSIILGAVDKILHSYCKTSCGFILDKPELFNPLDKLLVILHRVFPLDYLMCTFVILYIYFATLRGITRIGIRFLWIRLYPFMRKRTPPPGIMIGSIMLMLSILALNISFITLAPQYSNFGSRTYLNTTGVSTPLD